MNIQQALQWVDNGDWLCVVNRHRGIEVVQVLAAEVRRLQEQQPKVITGDDSVCKWPKGLCACDELHNARNWRR